MRIVADENIPLVRELFADFAEIVSLAGRNIRAQDLSGADALLIRSVTKVTPDLLAGSPVRFVGSATIGTDHVDVAGLQAAGIAFAHAPGCNANAVAEYVLASLFVLSEQGRFDFERDRVGIVGYGNVGKKLTAKLRALGVTVLINDPPLQRSSVDGQANDFSSKNDILDCDVITLHVPLQQQGMDSTWHWLDRAALGRCHARTVINTCRGPVLDSAALLDWLSADKARSAVIDVWEFEPEIDADLIAAVTVATPHIAGYSVEGKHNGTRMVFDAFCRHFHFSVERQNASNISNIKLDKNALSGLIGTDLRLQLKQQLLHHYDPKIDDNAMRLARNQPGPWHATFDHLRKNYPDRYELGWPE